MCELEPSQKKPGEV
jgi:hypothetical protein